MYSVWINNLNKNHTYIKHTPWYYTTKYNYYFWWRMQTESNLLFVYFGSAHISWYSTIWLQDVAKLQINKKFFCVWWLGASNCWHSNYYFFSCVLLRASTKAELTRIMKFPSCWYFARRHVYLCVFVHVCIKENVE